MSVDVRSHPLRPSYADGTGKFQSQFEFLIGQAENIEEFALYEPRDDDTIDRATLEELGRRWTSWCPISRGIRYIECLSHLAEEEEDDRATAMIDEKIRILIRDVQEFFSCL